MSLSPKALEEYYNKLLYIYNSMLNVLAQLENHNLNEALEIQKKTQALIQQSEPFLHGINHQKTKMDAQSKIWFEKSSSLHYKIEFLTQRCQSMIDEYKGQLRNKLKQIQTARRMNESQRKKHTGHIARI